MLKPNSSEILENVTDTLEDKKPVGSIRFLHWFS